MNISKIQIKNLFGIKELQLDGNNVELVGDNGTGKTSVIDAIRYALTNSSDRDYIIKNGAEEGEILIETTEGLSINRKKRDARSDYKKIQMNEQKIDKPESFLSEIFTELQLDPVKFIGLDSKEQNRILLNLIKFDWDMAWIEKEFGEIPSGVNYDQNILKVLHDIQSEKGVYYTTRHELNTSAREKKAIMADILADIPQQYNYKFWKGYDIDKCYDKLSQVRNDNNKIQRSKDFQESFENKKSLIIQEHDNDILKLEREIQTNKLKIEEEIAAEKIRIEKLIQESKQRIAESQQQIKDLDTNLEHSKQILESNKDKKILELNSHNNIASEYAGKEIIDTSILENEINTAKKMMSYINEYERVLKVDAEIQEHVRKSEELTEKIEHARSLPGYVLANSEIPIEDLSVKDGVVLISGLPISSLSEGEKLKLCIDIAMNRKNNLNLILIDGVEKLSDTNRTVLYEKLKREGVYFIATRTTNDNELNVVKL